MSLEAISHSSEIQLCLRLYVRLETPAFKFVYVFCQKKSLFAYQASLNRQ